MRHLEQRGLVTTRPGSTGREIDIVVTAKGERAAEAATPAWSKTQNRISELLGSDGVRALDLLVEKVNQQEGETREHV